MKRHEKILAVDNDPIILELLRETLAEEGYEVDSEADGAEAIKRLRTEHYDLVLTDFDMPGATGADIAREVRRMNLRTPVLVLTGSTLAETD